MDSPTERMPIACVHCAKAKAKCDKKVPCTRCVTKQIMCQSRATRRSSQAPPRRLNQHHRQHSDGALHTTAQFHVGHLPTPPEATMFSPSKGPPPLGTRHLSLSDSEAGQLHIGMNTFNQELDPHLFSSTMTSTPPDINIPITPILQNITGLEDFVAMNGNIDHEGDNHFLSLGGSGGPMDFDMSNMLDFMTPPTLVNGLNDSFNAVSKTFSPSLKANIPSRPPSGFTPILSKGRPPSPPLTNSSGMTFSLSGHHMSLQEPDAVSSCLDSWPLFRCNPSPRTLSPPKTAKIYLEGLAQTLRSPDTWKAWTPYFDHADTNVDRKISSQQIVGWSREKLIAITQGFLYKALEIHKNGPSSREGSPGCPDSHGAGFLMLPPPDVIHHFLKSYVVRHELYYACNASGTIDPSELLQQSNSKASTLLVLLMVAQGSASTPSTEARYLTSGLTEACRISLFDIIEKDVYLAKDLLVLRSALLFLTLAIWSGDKWHMDIAMGQRGMYLAMLNHGGLFEPSSVSAGISELRQNPEGHWAEWKEQEGQHRLAHSWVFVDQEMSLFSDASPLLSTVILNAPMPDAEILWQATSPQEWLQAVESVHGQVFKSAPSVCELFSRFVDGELGSAANKLSPAQLRLLLHPLQAHVCQLRQFLECLPDGGAHGKASRAVSKVATRARLEEISGLLTQWYDVSKQCSENIKGMCWTTCANLILYHLICLNVVTSFPSIEQFARRESSVPPFRQSAWLQNRCIDHAEEAFFHCGQVLRLVQTMPEQVRPPWWAGAVYRVALIAWVTRTAYPTTPAAAGDEFSKEANTPFAIDALAPEHPSITRYLKYQEGIPTFTKRDGSGVSIDVPLDILTHCCDILEADATMRLTDGIRSKLRGMIDRWRIS